MSLPYIGNANNTCFQAPAINSSVSSLLYAELQLDNSKLWDSCTNPISMFRQNNT